MPKKAKEKTEELNTKAATKKSTSKVATTKKATTKVEKSTAKKATKASTIKATASRASGKKNVSKTAPKTSTKKNDTAKKVAKAMTQKASEKIKSITTQKVTSKKTTSTSAKSSKTKAASSTKKKAVSTSSTIEYYDLPFRYNQTLVKILAQTPNMLFIYWDISDADRQAFEKQYGENFFEITRPVLIISNTTMNYTFEVEINDFANSWYLHINDANCNYKVELGRRFKIDSNETVNTPYNTNEYLYITASDTIEAPNDHILLDKLGKSVFFRNVKANFIEERSISSLSYLQNLGRIYNIYDLYKELYKDEIILDQLSLDLPSSNSSPTYK